jgi:hypothetical protein
MAPAIIDVASDAAKCVPLVAMVSPSVARAIEGAALNNPEKVFGLKRSLITAKAETTAPPIKNRKNSVNTMSLA